MWCGYAWLTILLYDIVPLPCVSLGNEDFLPNIWWLPHSPRMLEPQQPGAACSPIVGLAEASVSPCSRENCMLYPLACIWITQNDMTNGVILWFHYRVSRGGRNGCEMDLLHHMSCFLMFFSFRFSWILPCGQWPMADTKLWAKLHSSSTNSAETGRPCCPGSPRPRRWDHPDWTWIEGPKSPRSPDFAVFKLEVETNCLNMFKQSKEGWKANLSQRVDNTLKKINLKYLQNMCLLRRLVQTSCIGLGANVRANQLQSFSTAFLGLMHLQHAPFAKRTKEVPRCSTAP